MWKEFIFVLEIAMIFIGSIVGAGVCSGRELNQFFAVYGIAGFFGMVLCGILYVIFSKLIIDITKAKGITSYNEFVDLVCPKPVAKFTNFVLTLFLFSSCSIILAGSGSIIKQYFGVPRWIGILLMIGLSSIFLMRNTQGLFEVNRIVVPSLIIVMTSIFVAYVHRYPYTLNRIYMEYIPRQKSNLLVSTIVYVSFNILTIIGVLVPLVHETKKAKLIIRGTGLGSLVLTIMSSFIIFLMLVNPFYPNQYEMPLLQVAMQMARVLQLAMLGIMWLEMFSSQVSNVYSLSYFLKNRYNIEYNKGIFLVTLIAAPFSYISFSKLVEFLYPLYGVLSLVFLFFSTYYFLREIRKKRG